MENHGLLAYIVWSNIQISQIRDPIQDSFSEEMGILAKGRLFNKPYDNNMVHLHSQTYIGEVLSVKGNGGTIKKTMASNPSPMHR